MASKDEVKFAVVGTGSMAAAMMPVFDLANVRVAAVASRNLRRSQKFAAAFGIPTAADDFASLLRSGDFDAVYIANESAEHADVAVAALEAGKAVLCEKPLGLSTIEAEHVAKAARRSGQLCMEGLWIPFLPAYRRFVELAHTNTYGRPIHLAADFGYPASEEPQSRLFSPEAGGVLFDLATYLVALALDVFGPVESLRSSIDVTARGVDRHACIQLSHRNGGQSQLSASFISLMSNAATLACAEGRICLEEPLIGGEFISARRVAVPRQLRQESTYELTAKAKVKRSLRRHQLLRRLKKLVPEGRHDYLSYGTNKYLPQLLHFLSLLAAGAAESDVIPLERSLSIIRVLDRARTESTP